MVHCVRRASCQLRRVSGPLREESESPAEESQWSYFCTFRSAIGAQLQSPLLNSALQCRALGSAMPCLCPQSTIQCRPLKSAVPCMHSQSALRCRPLESSMPCQCLQSPLLASTLQSLLLTSALCDTRVNVKLTLLKS